MLNSVVVVVEVLLLLSIIIVVVMIIVIIAIIIIISSSSRSCSGCNRSNVYDQVCGVFYARSSVFLRRIWVYAPRKAGPGYKVGQRWRLKRRKSPCLTNQYFHALPVLLNATMSILGRNLRVLSL